MTFKSAFKQINHKSLKVISTTEGPFELEKALIIKRVLLLKHKRIVILLLLPLLILFVTPTSKYLYSIIFDNSPSMEKQIQLAQSYLSKTSEKLKDNSIFVLTSFPRCNSEMDCESLSTQLSTNIKSITDKSRSELVAETHIIEKKSELIVYLQSSSLSISNIGSPIYEAIWQNFITSFESTIDKTATKRKLIILSDGEDNLYRSDLGFSKPNTCIFDQRNEGVNINEFYDEISLIKYNGNGTEGITSDCANMNIYEGSDVKSFEKALFEQIEDVYFDKYFLIIVTFLLILSIISIQTLK